MRELELLGQYLTRVRQENLERAHLTALIPSCDLVDVKICAYQAELCNRLREAVKVLANDPGKFIQEYLRE